jgi:hypothetical protein
MLKSGVDDSCFRDAEESGAALDIAINRRWFLVKQQRMFQGRVEQGKVIDGAAFGRKQRVKGPKPIKVAGGESGIDTDRFENVPLHYVHALRQSATALFVINALHAAINDNTLVFLYFNGSTLFFDTAGRTDLVRVSSPHHAA